MSRLDIVIFGATGYTGKFVVRELANAFHTEKFSWGVAGRSASKLNEVLKSIANENSEYTRLFQALSNFNTSF